MRKPSPIHPVDKVYGILRSGRLESPCYSACMGGCTYHVHAVWDPEAKLWVATSDDVPGLATEASTIEALAEKLRIMVPELLEANELLSGEEPVSIDFELTSHRQETIRLAS